LDRHGSLDQPAMLWLSPREEPLTLTDLLLGLT
jgi:hypothetical protein